MTARLTDFQRGWIRQILGTRFPDRIGAIMIDPTAVVVTGFKSPDQINR